jgi:predicted metalloprotease with PDZ domain
MLAACVCAFGQPAEGTMAFTVSMAKPGAHIFHVAFRVEGLKGELQDFKMPAWTPGFYGILDYAKNVSNFRAEDAAGRPLPWEKVTRNTWRVVAGNAPVVQLNYDVYGGISFAAQNFLDEGRAYITPPGLFMHVAGRLRHPVTVAFQLPPGWSRIATGLDAVAARPNTFRAPDFDVLYDCPMLLGNQESLTFTVSKIPHRVAIENVAASVDREKLLRDLKRLVEAATGLMGDIPYQHYTFLLMGSGNGGIEHGNSASIAFNGKNLEDENGYRDWLSYVAHEYFHNFNVKRIRPIALGPFDYDRENYTSMLWVSEGLSVYYQDILMVRAGLATREQYLEKMQNSLARFENAAGHHYQSATESSMSAWGTGSGVGGDRNTSISYYDNGAMLGAMLDLEIRSESRNQKSLDDVMRGLYRKYYLGKKRGFTDAEFRAECESAAGVPLGEIFEYASTTKDVDYGKYFAYAGLRLEVTMQDAPGAYLGVNTHFEDGEMAITSVTPGSPAQNAGLGPQDRLLEVEGARATPKSLNELLVGKTAGDRILVHRMRDKLPLDVEVVLGGNQKRLFWLKPVDHPSELQAAVWKGWMTAGK